jgi:hypothetical protein
MANYLLINKQSGLIENVVDWDGDVNTWQPSEQYETMLADTQKPEIIWQWDAETNDWVEYETTGVGNIGETWDGEKFIQPKPPTPQPEPTPEPTQE